ncbi:DegT/DnrJ/EryC1/StrS family aminotransferase [Massilia sp. SR12]
MEKRTVQLFTPAFDVDACLAEIRICLERGWTGIGFKTLEIEKQFGDYIGQQYCHFLNSNTSGIHLIFELLKQTRGWADGDEVISTAMTFVSTNHSILHASLTPVFADVDDTLCTPVELIESKITPRTRAVIFVAIGGNSADLEKVQALCKARGLVLVLDAAHAAGSRLHGRSLSHYADYSIYSFQAVKNLPTADSGLITVQTAEENELVRHLSWCGINKDTYSRSQDGYKWLYSVDEVGYKYNGNSIMAAIAIVQLKTLDEGNARRREIARQYREKLDGVGSLRYIAHANESESSRHLVQFICPERNELIEHLDKLGVGTGVHYRSNTKYPMYAHNATPVADRIDGEIISLPCHLKMSDDDLEYVVSCIKAFYQK